MKSFIESKQSKKELSPEEKKIATSLESFQNLEIKDRIFLVLVWRKLKTASAISLEDGVSVAVMGDLEKRIKKAGLFFKKTDKIVGENEMLGLRLGGNICFVANNPEDLNSISKLWFGDQEKDPGIYRELGRMSGYPPTAIDPQILTISETEKIEKLKKEPNLIPFAVLFYMSKEHFENELETVRKWAEEIKLVTPALYQLFLRDFQSRRKKC